MSYDLQVWSATRPALPGCLPDRDWSESESGWTHSVRKWQLVVQQPVAIEAEDLPRDLAQSLPGLAFLTEIHLEPASAPQSARRLATNAANAIAKSAYGVVVDDQLGTPAVPRGVKRYRTEAGGSVDLLTMSWWWMGGALTTIESLECFLDRLNEYVPEAVPRRYGLYEPPEFKLEEQGRGHLVQFLCEAGSDFVIAYTTQPALGLTFNMQEEPGLGPHGFVAHHLRIDFDRSVLAQPGWEVALKRFWRVISQLLDPFYGDVRTLKGYERRGSRLWVPQGAEDHPVDGPFWAGVPPGPAHAVVVGTPYLELWPQVGGATAGGPRLLCAEDWSWQTDVLKSVGGVPGDLADLRETSSSAEVLIPPRGPLKYPRVWPFGRSAGRT